MNAVVRERVERGAALLEKTRPGSVNRLDPDTLDVGFGLRCPVGQEFGTYSHGMTELFTIAEFALGAPVQHGFAADESCDYPALTEGWRELVMERQRSEARELVAV